MGLAFSVLRVVRYDTKIGMVSPHTPDATLYAANGKITAIEGEHCSKNDDDKADFKISCH